MAKKFTSIESVRRENVKNLMQQNNMTRTELSQGANINYALLGHYIGKNPTKAIGDETARKIEEYFSKQLNWLDHEHTQNDLVDSIVAVNNQYEEKGNHLFELSVYRKFIYQAEEFIFEEISGVCHFHADFFKVRSIDPDDFRVIHALDNSMKPYIIESDKVGININQVAIKDGEIYAMLLDGKYMMLKQIFIESHNMLRLHSFNLDYPDKLVSLDDKNSILVVGKQVYRAG
ncbi:MAG: LexA family transcriptional regulator [Psychrobacter sp.]